MSSNSSTTLTNRVVDATATAGVAAGAAADIDDTSTIVTCTTTETIEEKTKKSKKTTTTKRQYKRKTPPTATATTVEVPTSNNGVQQVDIRTLMEACKTNSIETSFGQLEDKEEYKPLLEHLGDYINEPFDVLESYFSGKQLERLTRHQLESYNNFVNYQMQRTIEMFNPITIKSVNDYDERTDTFGLEVQINLKNLRFQHPQIHENNGATKTMMPQEARLRNFTYSSNSTVDLHIKYIIQNDDGEIRTKEKVLQNIKLCSLPVMLKSSICILSQYKHISNVLTGECEMDCGGYFIIKGSEKTILCQERAAENRIYVFSGKNTPKWDWVAEFKSVPDSKCISPKQVELMVSSKTNIYGHGIYVTIPRLKQKRYIELFVLFRALGVISDKRICEYILLSVDDPKNEDLLLFLEASIEDAKPFLKSKETIQQDAFDHVMSMVAYNPYQVEKGPAPMKKSQYTLELFQNDFFPHCKTMEQKLYLLGFMANRLICTALGYNPPDDRDSYLNKRIELSGSLLNNLFRNHYIRFVKDIEKQVVREINLGAWKSNEDYENIINMTNIYKIIKPATIENGLNRALSTGDFSVRQSNSSSKVGVAQVLNRLTYLGTLSHLRRVNTPLEKSGELVAPRKLHNTTWGFLCLTGDTEVLMSDRVTTKQIKDMVDGDRVSTVNPNTLLDEPSDIHSFFSKMPDQLFEITTISGRTIKATGNHPFLINENGKPVWKNLEELKPDDKMIIRHTVKYIPDENSTVVKINSADVLEHYKMELLELNLLDVDIPVYKLKIIARLIGSLNTDGHLQERMTKDKKYYSASFYVGEEPDVYQLTDDIAKLGFGNCSVQRKVTKIQGRTYARTWEVSSNGVFAYLLVLLGGIIGKKTNVERVVPEWLVNAEKSIKREYLSAFQGGDGSRLSYQKNGDTWKPYMGMTYQSTRNHLLENAIEYMRQISNLFKEFGIVSNVQTKPINDNTTKVCIVFEKSTKNYANYSELIGYTYCEEKRRRSASIIEHVKIKEYAKNTRDKHYQYIIDNHTNVSMQDMISETKLTENQIRKVIQNFKKGIRQSTRFSTDVIYDQYVKDNILNNGCISVPISSIVEIEPELVYDFTTRSDNHSFVASSFVTHNCPVETPEGQSIGIVKNISFMTHMTIPTNSENLYDIVNDYILRVEDVQSPTEMHDMVKVFINGTWVGVAKDPLVLYKDLKKKKHKGIINIYTSIVFDYQRMIIRICNDGGRMTRPVFRVENNGVLITKEIINKLKSKELVWNDLLTDCRIEESVIEYIDPEEQNHSMIAMKFRGDYIRSLKHHSYIQYDYCEIHPCTLLGVLASCVPFPDCNQAPRNTYQCAMAKQAIGISATNYDKRMDKTTYALSNPSRPLVDTRIMDFLGLNRIPSGCQIHVAIMSYTGYNQEDSVLINKSAIDRGLFAATIYHTEKDEDKNVIRDEIIRSKPDPMKTKSIKHGNYNKINQHGFIPENMEIENRDIIISKYVPIKENRNDPTKVIKYEDQSKSFRTTEETYVDKNYTGRNGEGCNFAKSRVRIYRKPVIGDKFCIKETSYIMTDKGWVMFRYLDITTHKVATLVKGEILEYRDASQKYEFDCDEDELYFVENKHVKIVCTTEHRMYVKKKKSEQYTFEMAKNIIGQEVSYKKNAINAKSDSNTIRCGETEYEANSLLVLLGSYIKSGKTIIYDGNLRICFSNQPRDNALSVMKHLGLLNIMYQQTIDGIVVGGDLYKDLLMYFTSMENKRFVPEIWSLSQKQSRLLLESIIDSITHTFITSSHVLAEELQRLAFHSGWSAKLNLISWNKLIEVQVSSTNNQPKVNERNMFGCKKKCIEDFEIYTGKVGCIEVPETHLFYYKDSRYAPPVWTGNSSRHGQKGTVGNIIPECDMPFTKDGLKPDLIINPHAIPSRMTIAHLKETLLGKILVELGMYGDGTSFGNLDVYSIANELQNCGFESYGNEILYDGQTGRQLETSIFIGPVFYQRLKHMVNDKEHSRSIGPVVNLTRQPAEGRSRDGGFRIGEMERDVMIAHGMSKFCRERMYDVADKYGLHVCKKCGMMATFNNGDKGPLRGKQGFTVHRCNTCDNVTDFAYIEVPYAFKLMAQELQTINVVPRIITT